MRNKIIILGGLGLLGKNLIKTCKERKIPFVSVGKKGCDLNLDLTNISLVSDMLKNISDETIINATGYTSLNQCEKNYDECFKINTRIVENFIENPLRKNFKFVQISTDQLYKGEKNVLNKEESKIKLSNNYAKSKFEAEKIALKDNNNLIIRTNFTGLKNNKNQTFYEWALDSIKNHKPVNLFDDMFNSTIDVKNASQLILKLALKNAQGIFNLGSSDCLSKKEFFLTLAAELKLKFTNYNTLSVGTILPKRNKNLGLDVSKISNYLLEKLPSSKKVIKNLVNCSSE